MNKYQVHFDADNRTYWIGAVVRHTDGSPAFVQQVGNGYIREANAKRKALKLNEAVI